MIKKLMLLLILLSLTALTARGQSEVPLSDAGNAANTVDTDSLRDEAENFSSLSLDLSEQSARPPKSPTYGKIMGVLPLTETENEGEVIIQQYVNVSEDDFQTFCNVLEKDGYVLSNNGSSEGQKSLTVLKGSSLYPKDSDEFWITYFPEQYRLTAAYRFDSVLEQAPLYSTDIRWLAEMYGLRGAYEKLYEQNYGKIAAGFDDVLAVRSDGTVLAAGGDVDAAKIAEWRNIVAVSVGNYHYVGLRSDGTVVVEVVPGYENNGQGNVSGWTDIVAISAGAFHTVGLKADGTVVAVGNNPDKRCNVSGWTDVVAIAAGYYHTVGLRADGTVLVTGDKYLGVANTDDWQDILAVSAAYAHTYGITSDNTVVVAGTPPSAKKVDYGQGKIYDWENITEISSYTFNVLGLHPDGTLIAAGYDGEGQIRVTGWENVVRITQGAQCTVALLEDGTVIAVGKPSCTKGLDTWSDIGN